MKTTTTVFLAAMVAVILTIPHAFSQTTGKANAVTLNVHLRGMLPGKTVYYGPDNNDWEAKKDSLLTEKDGFTLKIDIPEGMADNYKFRFGKKENEKTVGSVFLESGTYEYTSPTIFMADPGVTTSGCASADDTQAFKEVTMKNFQKYQLAVVTVLPTIIQQFALERKESSFAVFLVDKFYLPDGSGISDEDVQKIVKKMKKSALNSVHGRAVLARLKANMDKATAKK